MCPRCRKGVKSTSGLISHINTCKILITLPNCQLSNPKLMLDYNTTNLLDLPSDKNKENISLETSNNGKKGIKLIDMDNNKEDFRSGDIDK